MLILNFSHPLTHEQQAQIEQDTPLAAQVVTIADAARQTRTLIINPPSYAPAPKVWRYYDI